MIFGSVCSGIEAASTAWHAMGWKAAYVADIEPFPSAVLSYRVGAGRPMFMPDPAEVGIDADAVKQRMANIKALDKIRWGSAIPNYGDFTRITGDSHPIELLVGGTPCQAFSLAGSRQGLNDARGNLTLKFVELVHATKSLRWAVWENVPGVLSDDTNAFGCFLAGLVGGNDPLCVPGGGRWPDAGMVSGPFGRAAWRVLDAQHFGLAQRRRRVFVVFCPRGSVGDPCAVLLERKGVHGDSSAGRVAGQGVAPTLSARTKGGGGLGTDFECDGGLIPQWPAPIAPTLTAAFGSKLGLEDQHIRGGQACSSPEIAACLTTKTRIDAETETLIPMHGGGFDVAPAPIAFSAKDHGADATSDLSPTLRAGGHTGSHANAGVMPAIAIPILEAGARTGTSTTDQRADIGVGENGDPMFTLQAGKQHAVGAASAVRRLTPRECERLQGFPDDHTLIPWRGGQAPDGPRYKALGNSMAVPVMRWIGERIQAFEDGTLDTYIWEPRPHGVAEALMDAA